MKPGYWETKHRHLRRLVLNYPEITAATSSSFLPVSNSNRNNTVFWEEGKLDKDHQILLQRWTVDHDYISTMGMEIVSGRGFSREFATDSQKLILNQTAARNFGYNDSSILQQRISVYDDFNENGEGVATTYEVVGVVKDFHFESLKENITGLSMHLGNDNGMMSFRTRSQNVEASLDILKEKWQEYVPSQPFDASFMDERFADMYASTLKIRNNFRVLFRPWPF